VNGSPCMGSPLLGGVAFGIGVVFLAVGFLELGVCGSNGILLFGIGAMFIGIGAGLFAGLLVLVPSAVLCFVLILVALFTSSGASACWVR
jgi:hypothetical protein